MMILIAGLTLNYKNPKKRVQSMGLTSLFVSTFQKGETLEQSQMRRSFMPRNHYTTVNEKDVGSKHPIRYFSSINQWRISIYLFYILSVTEWC